MDQLVTGEAPEAAHSVENDDADLRRIFRAHGAIASQAIDIASKAIHRLLFHILEGWLSILQYGARFRMP